MPDWDLIVAIVALLFGGGLVWKVLDWWMRPPPVKDNLRRFVGTYYSYSYTSKNAPIIIRGVFTLSAKDENSLKISSVLPDYRYDNGCLKIKSKSLLMTFEEKHDESVYIVLREPTEVGFDILGGVFSALTGTHWPVAGKILLHKIADQTGTSASLPDTEVSSKIANFLKGPPVDNPQSPHHVLVTENIPNKLECL